MKKVKQSKKEWAWTKAQKKKHHIKCTHIYGGVPRWFCKTFHTSNKQKANKALHQITRGVHPDDVEFGPKYYPTSAKWWWW